VGGVGSGRPGPMARGQGLVRVRVPRKFRLGWLDRGDKRTREYRRVVARLAELIQHLGGVDELTAIERTLVERLAHVEVLAARVEIAVRSGKEPTPLALQQYFSAVDRCVKLSALLGLQRRARDAGTLQSYAREIAAHESDASAD